MTAKTKCLTTIVFISFSLLLFSCGQEKSAWKGTIEEVDDVTIVKNPKEPMVGSDALKIEEELTIGEAEGREEYMFSSLGMIAVNETGDVYAHDFRARHIKVFDESGQYVRTIGRGGEGPGEFGGAPASIGFTPERELYVMIFSILRGNIS